MARKIYTKENQIEKFGFVKTNEKIEVTFGGWDGKSYDGETRKMNVWVCDKMPGKKFVYKRQGGFENWDGGKYKIDGAFEVTDEMMVEKATGIEHPVVRLKTSFDVPYEIAY